MKVLREIETNNCDKLETDLHKKFQNKFVRGEWYKLNKEDIMFLNTFKYETKVFKDISKKDVNMLLEYRKNELSRLLNTIIFDISCTLEEIISISKKEEERGIVDLFDFVRENLDFLGNFNKDWETTYKDFIGKNTELRLPFSELMRQLNIVLSNIEK